MLNKQFRIVGQLTCLLVMLVVLAPTVDAQKKKKNDEDAKSDSLKSSTFSGLKWRSIGPAMTSGRIADFAVRILCGRGERARMEDRKCGD